jgi:hypothetical protein
LPVEVPILLLSDFLFVGSEPGIALLIPRKTYLLFIDVIFNENSGKVESLYRAQGHSFTFLEYP